MKALLKTANISEEYKIKEIDNCIFIIDNRDKVVQFINKANSTTEKGRKYMSCWDFTTLYTKIPHDVLKSKIGKFISKVFACLRTFKNPKEFICYSSSSNTTYYSKNRSKSNICFDRSELIKAVEYIIDHAYISFQNSIYRQIVGIPMGTNCAPFLANIYLHVFEYDYLSKLIEQGDIITAKQLSNMYRFQDDCIALNDKEQFRYHYERMYKDSAMELKCTNLSRDKCNFLDLTISIYRGKFIYRSYDKRNDFDFDVVNYPNLHGNIPKGSSYGVYVSQLLRFVDININFNNFVNDVNKLTKTFIMQGFESSILKLKYVQFSNKYIHKWGKYGNKVDSSSTINKIFH